MEITRVGIVDFSGENEMLFPFISDELSSLDLVAFWLNLISIKIQYLSEQKSKQPTGNRS